MQFRRLTAVWSPSWCFWFSLLTDGPPGISATWAPTSMALGVILVSRSFDPRLPASQCSSTSLAPSAPGVLWREDLSLTYLPFPVGAVDFSQKSSAWKSHPRCESARTVTIAYSTREGQKTGLETAETEGALWSRLSAECTEAAPTCTAPHTEDLWIAVPRPVTGRH